MSTSLDIRRLPGSFGVEVVGADRDELLGGGEAPGVGDVSREWHGALKVHQLVIFRGLELDAADQVALLATLGEPLVENETGRPYQFVSNYHDEGILGDEAFAYHSDHAFMPDPIEVISLAGLEIPESGTQTRFVNAVLAAKALPTELRDRIRDCQARHIIDPESQSDVIPVRRPRLSDHLPHAYHPILFAAARCDEDVLYVSAQQTDLIENLDDQESREIIEALFGHLYQSDFQYAHHWKKNDLVIWDNRALQHARDAVPAGTRRNLRRVSVGGTSVFDYFRANERLGFA